MRIKKVNVNEPGSGFAPDNYLCVPYIFGNLNVLLLGMRQFFVFMSTELIARKYIPFILCV